MLPIELLATTADQAPLIRNLYQFYAYESSDWEQEDVEVDGRFYIHDEHLQRYWGADGWGAYLVLADGFIAGFVLVERSELPGIDAFELADLFILKKYRRQGIGRAVALQLLGGEGDWLIALLRTGHACRGFLQCRVGRAVAPGAAHSPG
ncbi:hypothetical protein PPS11_44653 [Pseudomonas putida S11]|nr:hypothetical protein PPS11_44653 [Pseudomonas putida S11]